ncbi:crossover junction endodeoxyribonuclease RuvC [Candidatus Gracilibacteria bacterium]|nr:crossover junction endodeoxyribonuclease RuvC [Candidatus Gracilibacteria bacterium]
MKILGIDPGTATTGFAVIEKIDGEVSALDFGVISTRPKVSPEERLLEISENLNELIELHMPDLVAVESLFFFKNQTTAFAVAQARGVVLLTAAKFQISLVELTPLQVKQAVTGYGRAEKKQIQKMVKEIFALEKIPRPDDAADALAIAFAAS